MATKTRSRHLKDSDIEAIVELLDGWDGDVTWKALCDACGPAIGFIPTRQTLYKFSRVVGAYKLVKERAKEFSNLLVELEAVPEERSHTVCTLSARFGHNSAPFSPFWTISYGNKSYQSPGPF